MNGSLGTRKDGRRAATKREQNANKKCSVPGVAAKSKPVDSELNKSSGGMSTDGQVVKVSDSSECVTVSEVFSVSDVLSESKNNESSDGDSFEGCSGNESMPSIEDTCMAGEGGPDVTGSDSSEVLTGSNGVSKSGDTNIIDGSISILEDCSENGNFSNTEDTAKRDGVTQYDDDMISWRLEVARREYCMESGVISDGEIEIEAFDTATSHYNTEMVYETEVGGSMDFTCTDEHEDCILSAVSNGMIDDVDIEGILYSDSENSFRSSDSNEIPLRDQIKKKKKDVTTQTDLTLSNVFDYIKDCRAKMEVIDKDLKQRIQPFSEKYFVNDDYVKFYTGLPDYHVLHTIFKHVNGKHLVVEPQCKLTSFQEFVAVLVKLRLNCPFQDLAYRLNVSLSTMSRIFHRWLNTLDDRLHPLIIWPDCDTLKATMPKCFQLSFGTKVTLLKKRCYRNTLRGVRMDI